MGTYITAFVYAIRSKYPSSYISRVPQTAQLNHRGDTNNYLTYPKHYCSVLYQNFITCERPSNKNNRNFDLYKLLIKNVRCTSIRLTGFKIIIQKRLSRQFFKNVSLSSLPQIELYQYMHLKLSLFPYLNRKLPF